MCGKLDRIIGIVNGGGEELKGLSINRILKDFSTKTLEGHSSKQ